MSEQDGAEARSNGHVSPKRPRVSALPEGVRLKRLRPRGRSGLAAWIAVPPRPCFDAVPLIAVHGIKRAAREQATGFAERAAAEGRPVIAPAFDTARWPHFQQAVRHGRADGALIELIEELRMEGVIRTPRVDLCGYSAGAQFAHRFAMLHPQRVRRLTLASAGWYTFPDDAAFPYGLGAGEGARADWGAIMRERLPEFLALGITVAVGERDNLHDSYTRRGPAIDRQQGETRLERARAYAAALSRTAAAHGLPGPRHAVLPGVGHSFTACLQAGLGELVFSDPRAGGAPQPDPIQGAQR